MRNNIGRAVRLIPLALLIPWATSSCRGGEPAASASPGKSPAAAKVEIYNGLGRSDVCREVAGKLPPGWFATTDVYRGAGGRISFGEKETRVLADESQRGAAEEVVRVLGCGRVDAAPGAKTVKVIVGADAAGAVPPGAPVDGVFVKKSEKAVYFLVGGKVAQTWPCAIGKPETPTPTGTFKVTVTLEKPVWYWQGKAIPPGPENGLGDWFIGISKKGYGIHGTNEPASIGTAASHGCIRMYNEDAGALVKLVQPGTVVVITD